jgi:hypothetical protein
MAPRTPRDKPSGIWGITRLFATIAMLAVLVWLPRSSALYYALCAGTHIESQEADLDHDGYVSVMEASYACNVEARPVKRNGRACIEYSNRVDWRPIKEECE